MIDRRTHPCRILAMAAAVSLSACHVGPNYRAPPLPKGADTPLASLNTAIESPTPPPDAWWKLYNDARLDGLVQEALRANRDLAAAEANLAAARAVTSEVHAARYPSTDAAFGGVRGRDPTTEEILELTGREPQTIWLFEDIFQAAYEVDLFGRVHRAIESANANAEAVAATRDSVRVVVAAETTRAYATICAVGEQLDVAQHSFEVVSREADITRQRFEAGAGSQFDVDRAQALVAQVRASIPQLEGERRAALFELTALLGRTPTEAPKGLEACSTPPRLTSLIPVGDGRGLIRRRPDVRQAERRLAAATAEIGVATADLYPTIRLEGFFGGAATQIAEMNSNLGKVWGVGPSISWTFPNQAGPRARVRQAKAAQGAALASFDSVVLNALKETEQALTAYDAALANRQELADARDRIRSAFGTARDGYAAGSLSTLDLLTTEQSLVALDAAVAAADTTLIQDQLAIFKALGGGWETALTPQAPRSDRPKTP